MKTREYKDSCMYKEWNEWDLVTFSSAVYVSECEIEREINKLSWQLW